MTSAEPTEFLLDASALLALLLAEPGHEHVRAAIAHSSIHAVNVAEVIGKLVREGVPRDEATAAVQELRLNIIEEFTLAQAGDCRVLIADTRKQGLSVGDCVCLTISAWRGAIALTAERLWKGLHGKRIGPNPLRVRLIRP